jgi:EmrB/QacA subfamily drug resistance transporter
MKTETISTATKPYSKRWAALFLLCTAQFMVIMDTSIIGVALPAIQTELGYTASSLQWIFNAYVVVLGGLLLLGGRLSDIFGPKKIFLWGFGILTLASVFAGIAWSEASLNIARGLQGLGSAFIAPSALTLVLSMFTDPKEAGKALGFWGAAAAAGGSAGVFLGGALTQWLSWEWVFLINVPLGLAVMIASRNLLVEGARQRGSIDWFGAITGTASLIILVYAIVTGEQAGWLSVQTISLLVSAVLLFIAFIRRQKTSKAPLLNPEIFKRFNLTAGNIVMALLAASWIPLWFYLNLYLQQTLGLDAFKSGLALLPMTLAIMVLMVGMSGKLIQKFGFRKNLVAGLALLTASLFWFSLAPADGTYMVNVLGPSLLAAIGMSLAYIPGTMSSMMGAKQEEAGLASGLVNTSYQVGSAIGLAIVVALAIFRTSTLTSSGEVAAVAMNGGFQTAFIVAGIIGLLATVIAALAIRNPK